MINVVEGKGKVYGIYLYNAGAPSNEETWVGAALAELGFPLTAQDDAISTTSEESAEDEAEDPTYCQNLATWVKTSSRR